MNHLGYVICGYLARAGLGSEVAVVAGADMIERAHALHIAGTLAGFVSLSDSPAGIVIARQCSTTELARVLDAAIDDALALIGRDAIDVGETKGAPS